MSMHAVALLVLLAVANGAPILAKRLLGSRWDRAIDGGAALGDGQPLFGRSKTWRGLVAALVATSAAAAVAGESWVVGAVIGAGAMVGDLISSFTKRRLKMPPSSMAPGLDQIPEALLPALLACWFMPLSLLDALLVTGAFLVAEVLGSRVLYRLRIRDRPY
jgi:CDP-diglyceride synthetase